MNRMDGIGTAVEAAGTPAAGESTWALGNSTGMPENGVPTGVQSETGSEVARLIRTLEREHEMRAQAERGMKPLQDGENDGEVRPPHARGATSDPRVDHHTPGTDNGRRTTAVEDWLTDWISNPTIILAAIAVIALLWHGARWTQRIEAGQQTLRDGLKELGDGLKELRDGLKELRDGLKELGDRMDAQRALLEEQIEKESRTLRDEVRNQLEKESKTLRDEVRNQQSETRRTLDTLLLRVGGTERAAAGSSPLRLTEFGKRIEADLKPGKWVAATAERLRPETDGLEPFEIDALCDEYVRNRLDKEWRRQVARAAYEFGSDDRAVGDVLRILLRDALLATPNTGPNPQKAA